MPRTEWYLMTHAARTNAAARLQPSARHAFRDRSRHRRVLIRGMARSAPRHRGDSGTRRAGDDDDHVAPAASPAEHDHRRRVPPLVIRVSHEGTKEHEDQKSYLNWKLNTKSAPVLLTF